jgi:hypothetical protein
MCTLCINLTKLMFDICAHLIFVYTYIMCNCATNCFYQFEAVKIKNLCFGFKRYIVFDKQDYFSELIQMWYIRDT